MFEICKFAAVCLLVVVSLSPVVDAQNELADYLDKEVAGVAVISEPQIVWKQISNLLKITDEEWETLTRLATDESFGIADEQRFNSVLEAISNIESLLGNVKEIGFILHDLQARDFSITIKAEPSILGDLLSSCKEIIDHIVSIDRPSDGEEQDPHVSSIKFYHQEIGDWIVISNNKASGK